MKVHQRELHKIHDVTYKKYCRDKFYYPLQKRIIDNYKVIKRITEKNETKNDIDILQNFYVDFTNINDENYDYSKLFYDEIPKPSKFQTFNSKKIFHLWSFMMEHVVIKLSKFFERMESLSKKLLVLRTILTSKYLFGTKSQFEALEQSRNLLSSLNDHILEFHRLVLKIYFYTVSSDRNRVKYKFINIEQLL
mgnify:CR=1 FL=1